MRYLALIYGEEPDPAAADAAAVAGVMAESNRFAQDAAEAGVLRGGEALQPTSTATTIRVRDGRRLTADGPCMETKEALEGYHLLECEDLDQAIAWAARIPGAWHGAIELRPILELRPEDLAHGR